MASSWLYGAGVAAAGLAVMYAKQRKADRESNITLHDITWKGETDTVLTYKDHAGVSHQAKEQPDGTWCQHKTKTVLSDTLCTALTKLKVEYLADLKARTTIPAPPPKLKSL